MTILHASPASSGSGISNSIIQTKPAPALAEIQNRVYFCKAVRNAANGHFIRVDLPVMKTFIESLDAPCSPFSSVESAEVNF
jgi:hypothetical protein